MSPSLAQKKIGIWGFGVVGKSVTNYFHSNGHSLEVMDSRILNPAELAWLKKRNISYGNTKNVKIFLEHNDHIFVSAGIDFRPYAHHYRHKLITEIDLFYNNWKKPIIAITGTVGKTTTTHLLSHPAFLKGVRKYFAKHLLWAEILLNQ